VTLRLHTGESDPLETAEDPRSAEKRGDEISLLELASVLARRKRLIGKITLITALATTAVAFLIPVKYAAEAVIVTPQRTQPSMSSLAQLSSNGAAVGLSSLGLLAGFGFRNASDLYVGILQSRTIADSLIARFDLKRVYGDKTLYWARKHLARNTTIRAGKDTLIHIRVEDRSAERAAKLANAYVEELSQRDATTALNEAKQRRIFFEKQLALQKNDLADAEIALRNTQQTTGLVVPTGQAEAMIRSVSQLQAAILSRQAQLEGLKTYVTEDNPRFQIVKREIYTLQAELAKLQQGNHTAGAPDVPVEELPQAALEYLRKYRELKYHETLYEALAKQYEAARLDEAKADSPVQIVDEAVTPERKSWPPRALIIIAGSVFAAILSCCWMLVVHALAGRASEM
jgi:uncharacterized protein involved in exopolysaccharide biosynthesis